MPDSLYDRDFYTWTQEQARLLRAKGDLLPNDAVDWARVAEEIEDLGKAVASSIRSSYARIIEHLLKLEHSPTADPREGWRESVREHRARIPEELEEAPGLLPRLDELYAAAWRHGRRRAADSLYERDGIDPRVLPEDCPYAREQAEASGWYPANRHGLA